ncbi:MAG TPA: hypothetical protein VF258_01125 [Luteolibacter sp.]
MSNTTKKASTKGVRYTDSQKKEVVDFAVNYNAANGRGGQSKAAEKFGISQLTVASWLKAAGTPTKATAKASSTAKVAGVKSSAGKGTKKAAPSVTKTVKASAPAVPGDISAKLNELLSLSKEIAGAEAQLAKLQARFSSLKASL